MAFKKGQSGNPKGKPKGVINKRTQIIASFADDIVTGGAAQFKRDLKKMTHTERAKIYVTLMEFVYAKRARVEHSGTDGEAIKVVQCFRVGKVDIVL